MGDPIIRREGAFSEVLNALLSAGSGGSQRPTGTTQVFHLSACAKDTTSYQTALGAAGAPLLPRQQCRSEVAAVHWQGFEKSQKA